MSAHRDRLREMYHDIERGDFSSFLAVLDENVRWHLPGASPYAGTTTNRDELVARLLRQAEASEGSTTLAWVDGIGEGALVTVLERLRATRPGRSLDVTAAVVFRFADDRVVEAWDVFEDQSAYDEFWS